MKFFLIIILSSLASLILAQQNSQIGYIPANEQSVGSELIIIDSDYTLEEALQGITIPPSVKKELEIVSVSYYGFDGLLHKGQIIVNKKVSADIIEIFNVIRETKFPVEKVVPMVEYNWSDDKSMQDNNTSSFNYRFLSGSKVLSMHASGLAIDINPKQNPYVKNGSNSPAGSLYELDENGTICPDSEIVKAFKERGWSWGGDWKSLKDYQHFQKTLE
ncbi:MAG: M15 family metallopeptidase [Ignavibacterium sp.]|nr:MAG: M15 family metallopeptidase [Ignavibacterium sp.]